MRAVIDTNVIASAYISPRGSPAQILEMFWAGRFVLLTSTPILDEYQEILLRPRVQKRHLLTSIQVAQVVELIRDVSEPIEDLPDLQVIAADPDDDKFFACAIAGNADCIVSGDAHLLVIANFRGIPVLTPADFLARLDRPSGDE